jgi:hypothetical protein
VLSRNVKNEEAMARVRPQRYRKKKQKEGYKWGENEEEDISSYWITLRKGEVTGNLKKKH